MNTKSIRFRLITGYTGLIIMVVLGFGIYTYFKVDAYLNAALRGFAAASGGVNCNDVSE